MPINTKNSVTKLPRTQKLMSQAPVSFEGDLDTLFKDYIEPNLPHPDTVFHYHELLKDYCLGLDPLFLIRKMAGTERREVYFTDGGNHFRATDNAPVWWMHYIVFNNFLIATADFPQAIGNAPSHFHDIGKYLPTSISAAGFYVAHIYDVKDGNTNFWAWSHRELVKRFVRNIHPCNCFYVPKTKGSFYGENQQVIAYFASLYEKRYQAIWQEFLALVDGQPKTSSSNSGRFPIVFGSSEVKPLLATKATESGEPSITYHASRFTFISKHIEPLALDEAFRMVTNVGTFQMTRADFYRDFAAITRSDSYRLHGRYNQDPPPKGAAPYKVIETTKPGVEVAERT